MSRKPNILFISTFYPKKDLLQYCQFVHEEAKALRRKGYHISIINPRNDIKEIVSWTLEGIPILCLPYQTWRTNYSYIINSVFLFKALKALGEQYFKSFDFIHVHNCLPEGNAVYLLKKEFQLQMPIAVQVHDLNVFKGAYVRTPFIKYIFYKKSKNLYMAYDYCIGISNMVSDLIRSCLPSDSDQKVITSYNGYNPNIFNTRQSANNPAGSPIRILFVGNLIELKGIRTLIHAYCQVYPIFSVPTELWILGQGILEKEMKAIIHSYQMDENISFKGYVLPEKVADYMRQCHIFAMPSTFEGLGCVYLEAMACGLPCIACTGQGISEIIKSTFAGILIPPNDLPALKDSLLKLVNDSELRTHYKDTISHMISDYTWDNTVEPIEKLYRHSIIQH